MRFSYGLIAALGFAVGCGGSIFSPADSDGGGGGSSGAAGIKPDAGTGATGGDAGAGGAGGGSGGNAGKGGSGTGGSVGGSGGAAGSGTGGTSATGGASGAGGSAAAGGSSGAGGSGQAGSGGRSGAGGGGTGGIGAGGASGGGAGGAGAGGSGTGGTGTAGSGTAGSGTGDSGTRDTGIDWGACSGPGMCIAVRKGCCDPCGMPEVDSFAGVNSTYVDVFKAETCPVPMPCPKCPTIPNPNIAARCMNQRCEAFDVRKVPEYSACSFDSDCRLRGGLACCQPCSYDGPWVAVHMTSELTLEKVLCTSPGLCPPCLPVPPPGMRAVCTTGVCSVEPPCSLAPRAGCCFSDANCNAGQCYVAKCETGAEGMCKTRANTNECWGDRDCDTGKSCKGFSICPCGATCLTPDRPGVCG